MENGERSVSGPPAFSIVHFPLSTLHWCVMDPSPDLLQTSGITAALIALVKLTEVLVTRLRTSSPPPEHTPQKNAERISALEMTVHGMREAQAARYTELREWMGRLDRKLDELLVSLHRGG